MQHQAVEVQGPAGAGSKPGLCWAQDRGLEGEARDQGPLFSVNFQSSPFPSCLILPPVRL